MKKHVVLQPIKSFGNKLAKGEHLSGEFLRQNARGEDVWIQGAYTPIKAPDGSVCGVVKIAMDITEQTFAKFDGKGKLQAINKSTAVIEFEPDGTIIWANDNFLQAMGYSLEEIKGKHHRMFVEYAYSQTQEYKNFWDKLGKGSHEAGEFLRLGKNNRDIWIQASYNPIKAPDGNIIKVVKYASDITEQKIKANEANGLAEALKRSAAIIEFDPSGKILTANELFTQTVGYSLNEIVGRHHSMFVDSDYAKSKEYEVFWNALGKGEFQTGEFSRVDKRGNIIWLHATYNPILDLNGQPCKVVKYAVDITERVNALNSALNVTKNLSGGNLSVAMLGDYTGIFSELKNGLNGSVKNIRDTIEQIQYSAHQLKTSVKVINENNSALDKRVSEQSSAVEATVSAMSEMTSTTKNSTENAAQATDVAKNALSVAERGGQIVGNAIEAMNEIKSSSAEIAEIISVIDEIAFQTNILSLNAAVEAARAGEHGRSFAVVASEVRSLAGRCSVAAREIKGLIRRSVEKVEAGTKLVNDSGSTLEEIVKTVSQVSNIISDIATTAVEQSDGIDLINNNVKKMDDMNKDNKQMVRQANETSQQLMQNTDGLIDAIRGFKLSANKKKQAEQKRPKQSQPY